ncbi:MAG: hypothetical protein JRN09_03265 [Nitrososphaerota archaeon]|nr:hypothetical protein [Nitrososphaerota archaeon]
MLLTVDEVAAWDVVATTDDESKAVEVVLASVVVCRTDDELVVGVACVELDELTAEVLELLNAT